MALYGQNKYTLLNAMSREELIGIVDDLGIQIADVDSVTSPNIWLNHLKAGGSIKIQHLRDILTARNQNIPERSEELAPLVWSTRPDGHINHTDADAAVAQKLVEIERQAEDDAKNREKNMNDAQKKLNDELAAGQKKLDDERKILVEECKANSGDAAKKLEEEHKLKIAAANGKAKDEIAALRNQHAREQQAKFMSDKAAKELQQQFDVLKQAMIGSSDHKLRELVNKGSLDSFSFAGGASSSSKSKGLNSIFADQTTNQANGKLFPKNDQTRRDPFADDNSDDGNNSFDNGAFGNKHFGGSTKDNRTQDNDAVGDNPLQSKAPMNYMHDAFTPNSEGHMMTWNKTDSANYDRFQADEHAPELALINPRMARYALYTLSRQCKVSASALKSLKDYTAQIRVFANIPKIFMEEGYSHLNFWTQMSDSILAVSDMGSGDMQALKLSGDLMRSTKFLGRAYFRNLDIRKLGKLKAQLHQFTITLTYGEPAWKLLEVVKDHASLWNARSLISPTFWRDEPLKAFVGLGMVQNHEEADLKDWLQRQSQNYKAVGWALSECLDEFALIQHDIDEPFVKWLKINGPNRINIASREISEKGRGKNTNPKGSNKDNRSGPYNGGKGNKNAGGNKNNSGNSWKNKNNKGKNNKGKGKNNKGKNNKGKNNNSWDNSGNSWNTWADNAWSNNDWGQGTGNTGGKETKAL
jgi:hypothetical protein